jgi:broad-specificity NMP kinase
MSERRSHVLLIGGRSGVGKSTAAIALHELLIAAEVKHALIEGDYLDLAYPAPHEAGHDLAGQNLAAMWGNYRRLGYQRLIFTNTAAVVTASQIATAMGDNPRVTSVLLRSDDATASARLAARALGEPPVADVERSKIAAAWLDEAAPAESVRVDTDGRHPEQIARELATLTGWI